MARASDLNQAWLLIPALAAGAYLAVAALLWAMQEHMIFFPVPLDEDTRQRLIRHQVDAIAADGTELSGWALPGPPGVKTPVIIYFGGNAEEVSASAEELSGKLQLPVAAMNYRGYGASEGSPSAEALRADAVVGFDALIARMGVLEKDAIVIGRSLGSHMAAVVAARRNVGGLLLVTPFDSVEAVAAARYPIFPVGMLLRHRFDTVAETARIRAPALVISADLDRVVPSRHAQALVTNWRGKGEVGHTILAGAGHNDITWREDYWEVITNFVERAGQLEQEEGG